jgi:Tat protein translocase TatB subunit
MIGPIGGSEVILILGLALLIFGPRKLPEIGKTLGRTMSQLRRAATDFRMDLEREVRVDEIRKTQKTLGDAGEEIRGAVSGALAHEAEPTPPPAGAAKPQPEGATPPGGPAEQG